MMFWIMLPCNIIVLLIMHFTLKGTGKADGNIILGVKIPTVYLNHPGVQEVVAEFNATFKKLFWPCMLAQIIGYPIRDWVSISLLWVFLYLAFIIVGYTYCIEYYAKKLRVLKKENGWAKTQGHVFNVDTEVSRLKNTFPISRKWFLIPLALLTLFSGFNVNGVKSMEGFSLLLVVLVVFLTGVILYEIFIRVAIVTYSDNTEINIALNKAYKSAWSKYGVFTSYLSLLYLPMISMMGNENGYSPFLWVYVIALVLLSTVLSLFPMLMIHSRLKKLNTRLLQAEVEEYYIDDDEYWTTFAYNNPNSNKVFVNKRIGIGTTVNMGTTGGKVFIYGVYAFVAVTMIWCMWLCIPIDFDTVAMKETDSSYEVGIWGDTYDIQKDEIVSVELLEELPTAYKNVGSSTPRMKTGRFKVDGYGQSKIYAMVKVPLYIRIELEDETSIFFNGKDVETTREYYEMLE